MRKKERITSLYNIVMQQSLNDYQPTTPKPVYNGRIDIMSSDGKPYRLVEQSINNEALAPSASMLKGPNIKSTPLSELFFSQTNIDALQHGIRYTVYKKTCGIKEGGYTIGNQSEDELKIIMRGIFLQYAKNLPFNILEQVRELNARVIMYAVPRIIDEIKMYMKYKQDVSKLPEPMERGISTSLAGTKTLELKEF